MFGLHRRLLPALIGHLALFEMTSVVPARYATALHRHGVDPGASRFYDVHVEADAHHQSVAMRDMVTPYVKEHPDAAPMVAWGARALMAVEERFARALLTAWSNETSSLLPQPKARTLAAAN